MLAQEEARRLGHNFVGTEQARRPKQRETKQPWRLPEP